MILRLIPGLLVFLLTLPARSQLQRIAGTRVKPAELTATIDTLMKRGQRGKDIQRAPGLRDW